MTSLILNRNVRNLVLQGGFAILVAALATSALVITNRNLTAQGMALSWDFLERTTGWTISFSVIPYDISDSYKQALLAGFFNTLMLGTISLVIATVLGTVIGAARLSPHKMVQLLSSIYVQIFRNLPLILQAFFWYTLVSHLPPPRGAYSAFESVFISNRGVYMPWFNVSWPWMMGAVAAMVSAIVAGIILARRGQRGSGLLISIVGITGAVALLSLGKIAGFPLFDLPTQKGLRFDGGIAISPEVSAAIVSVSLFGAAYVAEVIRAGFQAVPKGQAEAGSALGLKKTNIFWHISLPLALRLMMPTMTNLVVWLMKATTIGIAIGYADYFAVIATSINHSGQTIPLVILLIVGFWAINLSISFAMNAVNRSIAIPGFK